jgi:hypothetical protein
MERITWKDRTSARYEDALKEAGIAPDRAAGGGSAHISCITAQEETRRLLAEQPDLTALMATNSDMALGAAESDSRVGLEHSARHQPGGFRRLPEIERFDPPITTIRQFPGKVGYLRARRLLDVLEGQVPSSSTCISWFDVEFVRRDSVAPPSTRRYSMIDLHAHSTFSDGSLTPARTGGPGCIKQPDRRGADRSRQHPRPAALSRSGGREKTWRAVPGVEISADFSPGTMHMLGYYIRYDDAVLDEHTRMDSQRTRNAQQGNLHKLNALGCHVTWEEVAAQAEKT